MLRNTRATIKLTKKRSAVNFGGALHDIRMNGCEKAWEFTRISIFSFKLLLFILFLILTGRCDVFSSSFTKYKRKAFFRNRKLLVLSWNAAQVQEFDPGHRGGGRGLGQPCAPHFFL